MNNATLFSPVTLGDIALANRIIMAPMTRSRADTDGCANDLMQEHYRQRASAGLIISEGVYPSEDGKGYCRSPGIVSQQHIQSWKAVTDAVHKAGGKIVMQLMHCGRIGHPANKQPGAKSVAPSAIKASGQIYTDSLGMQDFETPQALSTIEIKALITEMRQATSNALQAGFDGVELHCTSGYLPAQFLASGTNQRSDEYGGSVENRCRFIVECLKAMTDVAGSGRIGLRICPDNPFNDLHDDNPQQTFECLLQQISPLNLAYLHGIKSPNPAIDIVELARGYFKGPLIINDGFDKKTACDAVDQQQAAAVSFGRLFIANPDLLQRFKDHESLQNFDHKTLYTSGAKGYTDYYQSES